MSRSTLTTHTNITNHKTAGRGGKKIDKIFVHHMAGNLTVQQCGNVFRSAQASAHYGVNGKNVGCYVDEKDTAWHCGNFKYNQRSIRKLARIRQDHRDCHRTHRRHLQEERHQGAEVHRRSLREPVHALLGLQHCLPGTVSQEEVRLHRERGQQDPGGQVGAVPCESLRIGSLHTQGSRDKLQDERVHQAGRLHHCPDKRELGQAEVRRRMDLSQIRHYAIGVRRARYFHFPLTIS